MWPKRAATVVVVAGRRSVAVGASNPPPPPPFIAAPSAAVHTPFTISYLPSPPCVRSPTPPEQHSPTGRRDHAVESDRQDHLERPDAIIIIIMTGSGVLTSARLVVEFDVHIAYATEVWATQLVEFT